MGILDLLQPNLSEAKDLRDAKPEDSTEPLARRDSASIRELLTKEFCTALSKLAGKWEDSYDGGIFKLKKLKGAMTNHIYECTWEGEAAGTKVLVRYYGKGVDALFNRKDEIATFEHISKMRQGPRLLGRFKEGRIEEFIRARTLTASDLRNSEISDAIATKLWHFHQLDMPLPKKPMVWKRLRDWVAKARENDESRMDCQKTEKAFHFQSLEAEIADLERKISKPMDTIGFCHNDLQYGNIMLDDQHSVTIIDYEYASYNPVAFDIANHFCEMAADYHTDNPHELDFSKYPGVDERTRFVNTYLNASGKVVSDEDIQDLMKQVDLYELASHIHWGLWGIISAVATDIDFDYREYARQRFQRYSERKPELLS